MKADFRVGNREIRSGLAPSAGVALIIPALFMSTAYFDGSGDYLWWSVASIITVLVFVIPETLMVKKYYNCNRDLRITLIKTGEYKVQDVHRDFCFNVQDVGRVEVVQPLVLTTGGGKADSLF